MPRSLFISKPASAIWTATDLGKAEILQQIKDAEEKVRSVTKEAEEKRKQLQAEGKRRAIERIDAADAVLRKDIDAKISEAKSRIERRKKAVLDEGARTAEALRPSAPASVGRG